MVHNEESIIDERIADEMLLDEVPGELSETVCGQFRPDQDLDPDAYAAVGLIHDAEVTHGNMWTGDLR